MRIKLDTALFIILLYGSLFFGAFLNAYQTDTVIEIASDSSMDVIQDAFNDMDELMDDIQELKALLELEVNNEKN